MGLASVVISAADFNEFYNYLTTQERGYRNMHMRKPRQVKGKRVLRYLHAMYAMKGSPKQIEGMISGPGGILLHYKMVEGFEQLDVLDEDGDQKEIDSITRTLLAEIKKRLGDERKYRLADRQYEPKRTSGQYYLKRRKGGIKASHPTCQDAMASSVLDQRFIAKLAPWDLLLFRKG